MCPWLKLTKTHFLSNYKTQNVGCVHCNGLNCGDEVDYVTGQRQGFYGFQQIKTRHILFNVCNLVCQSCSTIFGYAVGLWCLRY